MDEENGSFRNGIARGRRRGGGGGGEAKEMLKRNELVITRFTSAELQKTSNLHPSSRCIASDKMVRIREAPLRRCRGEKAAWRRLMDSTKDKIMHRRHETAMIKGDRQPGNVDGEARQEIESGGAEANIIVVCTPKEKKDSISFRCMPSIRNRSVAVLTSSSSHLCSFSPTVPFSISHSLGTASIVGLVCLLESLFECLALVQLARRLGPLILGSSVRVTNGIRD